MGETAYDRVRKYVDYPHNQTPHFIYQSDLVNITSDDLRELADEIERLGNQIEAIMAVEAGCHSLRDCDQGMTQIKRILYHDKEPAE